MPEISHQMESQTKSPNGKILNSTKIDRPNKIAYGIGKAVKAVPEWHAKQFMNVYDKLYYNKLSNEEKKIAENLRPVIEKRAKVLGWVATGVEVATVAFGIAKGYEYFRKAKPSEIKLNDITPKINVDVPSVTIPPSSSFVESATRRNNHPFEGVVEKVKTRSSEGPMLIFRGRRIDRANDFTSPESYNREFPVDLEFAVHPLNSDRIIINIPGYAGTLDGYEHKYLTLAQHMQKQGLGAVVRSNNYMPYDFLPDAKARAAIEYAIVNAHMISGTNNPDIFMIGNSAGAGAVAAVAHEYPQIKRLMLWSPSFDMPKDMVADGLAKFTGEVLILRGANDEVLGPEGGRIYMDMAKNASKKQMFTFPKCGHYFEGEANGRILSQAPFFVFAKGERPVFPDPKAGIVLYK